MSAPNVNIIVRNALDKIDALGSIENGLALAITRKHNLPVSIKKTDDGAIQVYVGQNLRSQAESIIIALCLALENFTEDEVWGY